VRLLDLDLSHFQNNGRENNFPDQPIAFLDKPKRQQQGGHASIIDGIRLCFRYAYSDLAELESRLQEADAAGARFKLVVTDGVFSMDGYLANLPGICDLARGPAERSGDRPAPVPGRGDGRAGLGTLGVKL